MKQLCNLCSLNECWNNQRINNKKAFIRNIKELLESIYRQQWKLDLYDHNDTRSHGSNKLQTYRLYQNSFGFKKCLTLITDVESEKTFVN